MSLEVAGLIEASVKCSEEWRIRAALGDKFSRRGVEDPNHRHRQLLRLRRQRPSHRAAEPCDEFAPPDLQSSRFKIDA